MFDPVQPFVLLDDVAAGRARLFTGLLETLRADAPGAVRPAMARLAEPGPWAGYIGFEAGHALEPRLAESGLAGRAPPTGQPLIWMGRWAHETPVDAAALTDGHGPASVGALVPGITQAQHADAVARLHALIASGDIYQANLTFQATVAIHGHPLALYARLRAGSAAPYGALVHDGTRWLLGFSPELFFKMEGRRLTARPMKGTAPRGHDAASDAAAAAALAADPKNRAENLMITDLIRNDLSRVADGVAVPALFAIETYPTLLQMTSTITARARPGVTAADVIAAMFPCGSVTGAPKIRAMQVIGEVEPSPRGVYTGSIGVISADGDAVFNVAIRTLVVEAGRARLGLGSGIVADSEAGAEWDECLAKSAFLCRRPPPDLIETMRCESGSIMLLDRHLSRMAASARFLGFGFDPDAARTQLMAAVKSHSGRVRLLAAPSGALSILCSPMPSPPGLPVPVMAVPLTVDDWRLRHKTSDRAFYDAPRLAAGTPEVVFVRPDGLVTEGSFTTIFVRRGDMLLTPPLHLGLLPGVLRAELIANGRAQEAELGIADLASGFLIGNSLRGLLRATLADSHAARAVTPGSG
ncbi:aminodeoxychorismate synthase component I [Sandarakinorhabdus sp.]|uniref:aminodeoxychorismate synthase component I n=1 Tax=Sandarakinorhabdus sp. TaxID=1916663 RepID=UPI00286DE924|nr:aminodeoxychorismate synthase component I [Sandarakinorhabdus sp.]